MTPNRLMDACLSTITSAGVVIIMDTLTAVIVPHWSVYKVVWVTRGDVEP